jgi:hypothetical protein
VKKNYTIKELSDKFSVSTRTIERYLKSLYIKDKNKTLIPLDVVNILEVRHKSDTSPTQVRQDPQLDLEIESLKAEIEKLKQELEQFKILENERIEVFTEDDYQEFQKRLIKYPGLVEDLEYHRKSAESHQRQMEMILRITEQKNYIEAKEKNLDKK